MSAVLLGAFGSHGLRNRVTPRDIEVWETACKYQFYHSIALLVASVRGPGNMRMACTLFGIGMAVFSGSLYALVLTGEKRLGAVTPLGGLALAAGWVALALEK
jgi:uncharacterized membrane protein YgdD (TMEM256/DUF423 family)